MYSTLQLSAIQEGALDGGFCYVFEKLPGDCRSLRLRIDRVLLAVPRRYGWRNRQDLRLTDLADEPFVGIQRASAPLYIDRLMQAVVAGGLSPRVIQEAVDETTMLSLVSAGIGVGFVNSANEGRKPQFVDFVPLRGFDVRLPLYFVWKKGNASPPLMQFLSIVERQVDVVAG
jgi:DNA-binding transcriptional LysR family regulator